MTEYEHGDISVRLALAIGWPEHKIYDEGDGSFCSINISDMPPIKVWRDFDYRDPAVIWPIAERFDCFPIRVNTVQGKGWIVQPYLTGFASETAAQAVALSVIAAKEAK